MKRILLLSIILFHTLLSGCAYLSSFSSDLPDKIDSLIKQEQYAKALDIIKYVKPNNPDYKNLIAQKKRILRLAKKLENDSIEKAHLFVQQGEWYQAQLAYETALQKLPPSPRLEKAYKSFLQQRKAHLQKLELILLLNKANWLIGNKPVQKEIKKVLPDAEKHYEELKDYPHQIDKTAEKLAAYTKNALKKRDYSLAKKCLSLIEKLGATNIDRKFIRNSHQQLAKAEKNKRKKQDNITRALIAELTQGISHENLQRARQHLDLIKKQKKLSKTSRKLYNQLKKRYRAGINQGIAAGRKLYSSGKIREALEVWNALLLIDTDNQKLEEHINRANRVLKKLHRLSRDGAGIQPPNKNKTHNEGR